MFAQQAARFADLAPWEILDPSEILWVEGLGPEPVGLSVQEEEPGLAVLDSGGRTRALVRWTPEPVATSEGGPADEGALRFLVRCMQVVDRFLAAGLEEEGVEGHLLPMPSGSPVRVTMKPWNPLDDVPAEAPAPPDEEPRPGRQAPLVLGPRPGRNDPCWCGSGKKYKKCHLDGDRTG